MNFTSKLVKAKLIRRYKRFLADVMLLSGKIVVAHIPNTGSLMSLIDDNPTIYLIPTPNNKLKFKVIIIEKDNTLIFIDTISSNKVVYEALCNGNVVNHIPALKQTKIKSESTIFNSRLDFKVNFAEQTTFIEVKSVTLSRKKGLAEFPDSVTARGSKHLMDLSKIARNTDYNAMMLYLVNRNDCNNFSIASDIDLKYYENLKYAIASGVKVLAMPSKITLNSIVMLNKKLNILW